MLCVGGGAPPAGPSPTTDDNKSTKTLSACGGNLVDLSNEKGQEPVPQWAFIGFNLHRNIGRIRKAHQPLPCSNDQTKDNVQRTTRAYLESGSDS